jgi:3-hydroxymyristoyl/3-hydroxydecanoyl-(acyl carrier protein) dehydratase
MSEVRNPFPRLPHAAPFLLLDRVLEIGDRMGVFVKHVAASDPCVAADGTLPAAFLLEALAQGGGALLSALKDDDVPQPGYLAAVDDFQVLAPVRVGDVMRIEVEVLRHFQAATQMRGRALVDGQVCAEGRLTLALPRT